MIGLLGILLVVQGAGGCSTGCSACLAELVRPAAPAPPSLHVVAGVAMVLAGAAVQLGVRAPKSGRR